MDPKNGLENSFQLIKEGKDFPKIEPIDVDFIKKEEIGEDSFKVQGIVEYLKVDKESIKGEIVEVEGSEKCSSIV